MSLWLSDHHLDQHQSNPAKNPARKVRLYDLQCKGFSSPADLHCKAFAMDCSYTMEDNFQFQAYEYVQDSLCVFV